MTTTAAAAAGDDAAHRAEPRWPVSLPEVAFAVATFLLTTEALLPILRPGAVETLDSGGGDPVKQLIFLALYGVSALLLVLRNGVIGTLRSAPLVWIVVAIVVASITWSADPAITLRRSAAFAATSVFAVYLGATYSRLQLARLIVATGTVAIVLTIVIVVRWPELGWMDDARGRALSGVFQHKNELGRFMSWTLYVAVLLALTKVRRTADRPWALAVAGGAAAMLVLSGSKAGLVVAGLLLLVPVVARMLRAAARHGVEFVGGIVALATAAITLTLVLMIANFATVTGWLGRDPSLTGRTWIWESAFEMLQLQPWLGYGYSAFWGGEDSPANFVRLQVQDRLWGLYLTHAHNGFLDLLLQLGVIGSLAWFMLIGTLTVSAIRAARRSGDDLVTLLPIGFLVFLVVYNLIESRTIGQNSFMWVLTAALSTMATAERAAARRSVRPSSRTGTTATRRPRVMRRARKTTS